MLSLSPRYDLFKLVLPKDFLPSEVIEKYSKLLNKENGVLTNPIDYLLESVQKIHIPGISELVIEQQQHESNMGFRIPANGNQLGKINVEPNHNIVYKSSGNPLDKMEHDFRVTFRMNHGFYNYFMIYETIFNHYCKNIDMPSDDVIYVDLFDERCKVTTRIKFTDVHIDSLDGLDFEYKSGREETSFDVVFRFNNINFDFLCES